MFRWYLIHTKPSGEAAAKSNLERQGYEVYLPRLAQPVRHRGRWRERIVALFPRYLFVGLNEGRQALGPVRSTVGVANVVRFGARYAVVADQVIRDLRSRADAQTGLHRLDRPLLPEPGTLVKIADGPFDGLEGVFEREAGSERVVVLLHLLGQAAPVRIPLDAVASSLAV